MKTGRQIKLPLPAVALHGQREYHTMDKIQTEPACNITVTKKDTKPHHTQN